MQGWREHMEDQHTVLLGMPQLPDHSFIAVYDGHGGEQTAQIASEQLHMIYDRITLVDGGPLSVHQFLEFTRAWSVFPNMLSSHQVMQVFAQAALVPIGGGRRAPTAAAGL